MSAWCLTISDAEPPSPGFHKALDRNGTTIVAHHFRGDARRRRPEAWGLFIFAGDAGRYVRGYGIYPHITLMLGSALHQKAGLLFFVCREFHVSLDQSGKLFFELVNGRFRAGSGQSGMLGLDRARAMAESVNRVLRPDITRGITAGALAQGMQGLRPNDMHGLPPWEREARERQQLESGQARLRDLRLAQDEQWARQFEWPDDM